MKKSICPLPLLLDGLPFLSCSDQRNNETLPPNNGPAPSFRGSRAGNMRGCKASLFDGGMHMPFIIWDTKDEIPEGKIDATSVVSALDMFESLCKIAGISLPENYVSDGMDMSKALLGIPQERNIPLFWEYRRNEHRAFPRPADSDISPNVAVRDGEWKLLVNRDGTEAMLYNLYNNPRENMEVSEQYPEVTNRLKEIALNWRNSLPAFEATE